MGFWRRQKASGSDKVYETLTWKMGNSLIQREGLAVSRGLTRRYRATSWRRFVCHDIRFERFMMIYSNNLTRKAVFTEGCGKWWWLGLWPGPLLSPPWQSSTVDLMARSCGGIARSTWLLPRDARVMARKASGIRAYFPQSQPR